MNAIKKKVVLSFTLVLMMSFAYSQGKKTDCPTIKRKTITEAKTISDVIPELNGCSITKYEMVSKVKGKPMTAVGNDASLMGELKTFALHCDKDSRMYIDVIAECNGKKVPKKYCFKLEN